MAAESDVPIEMIVGPEYVTGSSRMKSGTGQKMILNMITTSVMIQLGRVKGNKMVNMQLSNKKLVDRGTRMLVEELGLDYGKAKALLLMHGSVKKAADANVPGNDNWQIHYRAHRDLTRFSDRRTKERKNRLCLAACGIFRTVYVPGSSVRKSTYSKQDMKTLTSILVLLFGLQAATAQPLQQVAPEQAGLDSRKLMYADEAIETVSPAKRFPAPYLQWYVTVKWYI